MFKLIVVACLVAVAVAAPAPAPGYVVASPVHYVPSHHVVHHAPIVKTVVHHTPIVKYKTIPVYKAVPVVHLGSGREDRCGQSGSGAQSPRSSPLSSLTSCARARVLI
nr:uncharacterized protein LOC115265122 [Aedes albopictus]